MVLRRRLPSATALFTFEAAARLMSFSRAAKELNITQPAVSHSVAALEDHLGEALFIRAGPKIELTESGERLSRVTSRAFLKIEDALIEFEKRDSTREVVMLSVSSGMATHWLMPRYNVFRESFPETDLQFQLLPGSVGGPLHNCDLGLRVASGKDSRRLGGHFAPERVIAVGAPGYLREHGSLEAPRRKHTLISLPDHWFDWPDYASAAKVRLPQDVERLAFSDYSVVIQAALSGQGLALAWTSVASKLIIDGMLEKACDIVVLTDRSYHFVTSSQRPARPVVNSVRNWLIEQMQVDERELECILGDAQQRRPQG